MSNPKFQIEAVVIFKGEQLNIVSSIKDFATNKISYRLSDGTIVSESDLSDPVKQAPTIKTPEPKQEQPGIVALVAKYMQLYGKQVPPNKKKDAEWILTKIKEKEQQNDPNKAQYEAVSVLDRSQLGKLIEAKELDLDVNDFNDDEEGLAELIKAVCQELGVQIPV
jgi:hypothetical protein